MRLQLLLLILLASGCHGKLKDKDVLIFKPRSELTEYELVAFEFYTWYLDKYYNGSGKLHEPMAKLNNKGVFHLDTQAYNQTLRNSGFFSSFYFEAQSTLYDDCNKNLKNVDSTLVAECGCNPATFAENCEFTFYYNWLFHQGETTHLARIISSNLASGIAVVKVCLQDTNANPDFCVSTISLELSKDDENWKINKIENSR